MRLLLRANAHRILDGESEEIAASPDTPNRESWQWHIRLHTGTPALPNGVVARPILLQDGSSATLEVAADPEQVDAHSEILPVPAHADLVRSQAELMVLLVVGGAALVEGRHLLEERDALVLEGDDPLRVGIDAAAGSVTVAVIRLHPVGERALAWVP